jgi:cell division protein FtsB
MKTNKARKRTLLFIVLFVITSLLVYFNINLYRERKEIKVYYLDAKQELEQLKEEMEIIEQREEERDLEEEIEIIAREQLLLRKEGERVFVISREEDEEVLVEGVQEETEEEKGFFEKLFD